ncbi:hypothetical protein ABG768_006653 [Culter alburnus]|uniref:Uncharacterized protein n=1 Tax=Culter alburnus TaxID=194366 RepID=A0AAW1ZQ94_CULAL
MGDVGRGGRDWPQGYLASRDSKSQGTAWTECDWSFLGLESRDENKRDTAGFPEASPEPWSTVFSPHNTHWLEASRNVQTETHTDKKSLQDSRVNVKTSGGV